MVATIASFGSPRAAQGLTVHAVSPVAVTPVLRDQPRPAAPLPTPSAVAFAPAAMTALIEAQERLAQDAPPMVRQHTAQKIDQLIARLDDDTGAAPSPASDVPFAIRQLVVARQALSESLVDLQA